MLERKDALKAYDVIFITKAFNKSFYKILIEINVFLICFCSINVANVSNVYNIILKYFADVSIYVISINANILTFYLNNIIINYSNHE